MSKKDRNTCEMCAIGSSCESCYMDKAKENYDNDSAAIYSWATKRNKECLRTQGAALISQSLKQVMSQSVSWSSLEPYQKECLEALVGKMSLLLEGHYDNRDVWVGLVADALIGATTSLRIEEKNKEYRSYIDSVFK